MSGRAGLAAALLAAGLAAGLLLAGGERRTRADLVLCNGADVRSLDPARASSVAEGRVVAALFDGLVRPDAATGRPRPALARSWASSADGRVWTFTLREDALFTDGRPIRAEQARASLVRLVDPASGSPFASLLWTRLRDGPAWVAARAAAPEAPPPPLDAIAAPVAHELVLTLAAPCPFLPEILALPAFGIVPVDVVAAHGARWTRPEHIVSSGPFRLVERRVRDRLRLERFEHHPDAAQVALRTIDVYAAESLTTQLNLFLTGAADWMGRPPRALVPRLAGDPALREAEQLSSVFLRFNTRRAPLDDQRVRAALALALDRERLVRDVLGGRAVAAGGLVPRAMPGYAPPPGTPHDPERARALLGQALAGAPLRLALLAPHNEDARDLCAALADQWRAVLGVDCRLLVMPWPAYLDATTSGSYDVAWSNWTADYAEPTTFLDVFTAASPSNRTGFADPEYDARLLRAAAEPDAAARAQLYAQAEAHLLARQPIAPLYWRTSLQLVAPGVTGFLDNPLDVHPLRDLARLGPPPEAAR